jgi:hypothetical protein
MATQEDKRDGEAQKSSYNSANNKDIKLKNLHIKNLMRVNGEKNDQIRSIHIDTQKVEYIIYTWSSVVMLWLFCVISRQRA